MPELAPPPPVRRALLVETILQRVFKLSDGQANAVNARVCKAWSKEALSILWEDVDVSNVLSLLAPLGCERNGRCYEFTRAVKPEDWSRFDELYSWRIHKLRLTSRKEIAQSAWVQLSLYRPRMDILPSLKKIIVVGVPLESAYLFCHSSVMVQKLSISLFDQDNIGTEFSYLPRKMPNLTHLHLYENDHFEPGGAMVQESNVLRLGVGIYLRPTMKNLPSLVSLRLSSLWLTPATMSAFASIRLKSLELYSFPGDFPDAAPRHVRCKSLIEGISSNCPHLERLIVASIHDPHTIPFNTFKPILLLTKLKVLDFYTCPPFSNINAQQFVSIFKALPELTMLSMQEAICDEDCVPALNIKVLVDILPYCSNLETLEIELDSSIESLKDPALLQLSNANPSVRFSKLRKLHMGCSPISVPLTTATFLGMLLPARCVLEHTTIRSRLGEEKRSKDWGVVKELLEAFRLVMRVERRHAEENIAVRGGAT